MIFNIGGKGGGGFAIPTFDGSHAVFGDEKQGYIELYSSGTLTFPKKGTVDVFLIGGGSNGKQGSATFTGTTAGYPIYGGTGGDGGKKTTLFSVKIEAGEHNVIIASSGGNSSFDGTNTSNGTVAAVGAARPTFTYSDAQGNAAGKKGTNGNNADYAFGDSNFLQYGGSGGSGAATRSAGNLPQSSGGVLGGGKGYGIQMSGGSRLMPTAGTANTGGGGGGGGYSLNSGIEYGAAGGSGIVIVRWGYSA